MTRKLFLNSTLVLALIAGGMFLYSIEPSAPPPQETLTKHFGRITHYETTPLFWRGPKVPKGYIDFAPFSSKHPKGFCKDASGLLTICQEKIETMHVFVVGIWRDIETIYKEEKPIKILKSPSGRVFEVADHSDNVAISYEDFVNEEASIYKRIRLFGLFSICLGLLLLFLNTREKPQPNANAV